MPVIRYYYHQLPSAQQAVYEQVLSGLTSHKDSIKISGGWGFEDIWKVVQDVLADHPQLFYVSRGSQISQGWLSNTLHPTYLYSKSTASRLQKQIDDKVNALYGSIFKASTDLARKESAIYTRLAQHTKYTRPSNENESPHYSIVGSLLDELSVCEGYSKAFKYLCDAIGLPCLVVSGIGIDHRGEEPHAWNIVKLNGKCYHADVTWDSCQGDMSNLDYFHLSDAEIGRDHTWDRQLVPKCSTNSSTVQCVNSRKEFEQFVLTQVSQRKMTFPVKFNKQFDDGTEIVNMVLAFLESAPNRASNNISGVEVRYNKAQCKAVIQLR